MTRPRQALPTKRSAMMTGREPRPASVRTKSRKVAATKPRSAPRIDRAKPTRAPRGAATCEAAKKPSAFSAKARLNCVGVRPKVSV
jgi:hypothetical protein